MSSPSRVRFLRKSEIEPEYFSVDFGVIGECLGAGRFRVDLVFFAYCSCQYSSIRCWHGTQEDPWPRRKCGLEQPT